jgi:exodeoxyribonuclease III
MRISSWNVNGLRAVQKKGFSEWLESTAPDVAGLQEIKCQESQLDEATRNLHGYQSYFFPAQKAGYSGVALYCRKAPVQVIYGMGIDDFDAEGRVITAELDDLFYVTAYFPNSQDEGARLAYKLEFNCRLQDFLRGLSSRGKPVLLGGDLNVAHHEIDIYNPKANIRSAGFLPEERAWMSQFLEAGYRDLFREVCSDAQCYTWWSYMFKAREKNRGWRIDYLVGDAKFPKPKACVHQTQVLGSDHCPIYVDF